MKKYIIALAVLLCSMSLCSCKDKSESSSISVYADEALENSSKYYEENPLVYELNKRYTIEEIEENKKMVMNDVFPQFYDDLTDTDGDGLIDLAEADAKTDPNNADTDGDGVDDFCEIYLLGTDPLTAQ